ncbi:hypothetical protein GA0070624_2493 [Micromonospora rhizosphaerae]|uniref:Uncharacterized protein n=1 Tax=Micromonospora rhizosphaerae TaxID=568872 RepID=A0A1C6RYD7_9ACTN|nr:hypothetical protein [Micromonospora rhizosphaerae]SCL22236.1 hypothetical protein GA0070624_2493 [Micromonospora rhizosphaerae]
MSQPPTGPEGFPPAYPPQPPPGPQPAGGTVYGSPYGAGQPEPPRYGPAQPDPTLPQPAAPPSAPPVPGQFTPGSAAPVSGPSYTQPMSAPPMSAPPVSGPGFGQPMSAPPGPNVSYGAPAPGARKSRATLILALVAGLLFVLGGVMTGLFVTTNNELHRTEKQVSQRDGTITANKQEIDKLKADLQTVQDKLADTEQDLTGTKNDRDEQARQKKVIATCLDKLTTAIAAASAGDRAAFDKANKGLDKVCDEAENYL